MDVVKAHANQLANIEKRTGKALADLVQLIKDSNLAKHGEIVAMLKDKLGIGHGDANALAHHAKGYEGGKTVSNDTDVLAQIYSGPKEALRPIHKKLMDGIQHFGEFEIAPKKGYVSLRRKKQFAMLGPATNTRFELGLNMKGAPGTDRLLEQPAGGMCQYKVKLTDASEVDEEVLGWVKQAYDSAG
jgi:hypothetical protein